MIDNYQPLSRPAAIKGALFLLLVVLVLISYHLLYPLLGIVSTITATTIFVSRVLFWVATAVIWFYSVKVDNQPLLIWKEKKYAWWFYPLSVIVLFLLLPAGVAFIQQLLAWAGLLKQSNVLPLMTKIFSTNMPLLLFTCLTAGVTEEIIFRVFLMPRLEIIFNNSWLAIILSSLLFGLGHAGFGTIINVVAPLFIGLAFAWHYWKFRNIKLLMFFHFLWDLVVISASSNVLHR